MKTSKIQITESELKHIVAESVKKVLNEISSDLAYAASNKAKEYGRPQQAKNFADYGTNKLKTELGTNDGVIKMNNQLICYYNSNNDAVTLYSDGYLKCDDLTTSIGNYDEIKASLKTNSKPTARLIVKWLEKYMSEVINNVNPQLLDWHFWVNL